MSEIDIINDYKNTVQRLQQECTEKTDTIIVLGKQLHRYKQTIENIEEYCKNHKYTGWVDIEGIFEIIQKCGEVNS